MYVVGVLEHGTCDYNKRLKILPETRLLFFFFFFFLLSWHVELTRRDGKFLLDFASVQTDCDHISRIYAIVQSLCHALFFPKFL